LHCVDEFYSEGKSNLTEGFITTIGTTVAVGDVANIRVMSLNSPPMVKGIPYDNMRLNGWLNFKIKRLSQGNKHHGQHVDKVYGESRNRMKHMHYPRVLSNSQKQLKSIDKYVDVVNRLKKYLIVMLIYTRYTCTTVESS